ncbi:MAG: DNA repair protein RecO C-terminal domain-containing protein [Bacteroidaceae bacterium]|nr:DNA repair protein RecO C-terminal domain-containing protein [Bacteroidaceae bacterium]MBP5347915.1 DNA repair protein RecO C-terminal domain-containing protein [Bacteroidaceae bacterium]
MWEAESGILIGAVRHNDRSSVARIFTRTHGMVPFIWFLSKSGKNASRNTLLQPLTHLEFQAEYVPTQDLHHIKEAKNSLPYREIPFNPQKSAIALFLSEFLTHALRGEQNNPGLYSFLTESLRWLDSSPQGSFANFHVSFMLGTARHIGISPNADEYTPGCILDMRDGCFSPILPKHTEYMPAELSYKLYQLMNCSYDTIKDAPLTGQERVMLLNALNTYFRLHIPSFPVLKSIEVLDTVFG